ncbi:MAG: type II toxin-antitoxin system VapC family toxin [Ignavibacteria bacterium]
MNKYLLDTDICIYFLKGMYGLNDKIVSVGIDNCFISEITVAELKFGAANSEKIKQNKDTVENFISLFSVIPVLDSLDIYASEKTRLKKTGKLVDDFDLLIGSTAITNDLILVTNNKEHFSRLNNIKIVNWTK